MLWLFVFLTAFFATTTVLLARHVLRLLRLNASLFMQTEMAANTIHVVVEAAGGVTDCLEDLYTQTDAFVPYSKQARRTIVGVISASRKLNAQVLEPENIQPLPAATRWPYDKQGQVKT